jgi:stalled ribosome rescue protein Dom34
MPLFHALVWIDRHRARVLQFDVEKMQVRKVQAHTHDEGRHGEGGNAEQEFFAEVCDELTDIEDVLVAGSDIAQGEFRHYVDTHRPALSPLIVGWETVEYPTQSLLEALARQHFAKREGASGRPRPG